MGSYASQLVLGVVTQRNYAHLQKAHRKLISCPTFIADKILTTAGLHSQNITPDHERKHRTKHGISLYCRNRGLGNLADDLTCEEDY